jgi:soluble P-type ATPase
MDSYIAAGYDFCFLTARSCEDVIKRALDDFLRIRDRKTGALSRLGSIFNKTMSHAINDTEKQYKGITDADKKANVLRDLCKKYDKVIFVDDDTKNVQAARNLNLKNLKVINAWEN